MKYFMRGEGDSKGSFLFFTLFMKNFVRYNRNMEGTMEALLSSLGKLKVLMSWK